MAVRGVHDERVGAGLQQGLGLAGDVAVDADGGGDPQLAGGVDGRGVEGGAQRVLAGEQADQAAVAVDDGGELAVRLAEPVEGVARVDALVEQQQVAGHHLGERGEAVDALAVGVGDDADGAAVLDHDQGAVGALGQQRERLGDGGAGVEGDGGVVHQVTLLDPADDLGDDLGRDVLRDGDQAAAAGDGLGHPAAGDGGHVGHDQRDGGAGAVVGGQVDSLAGAHGGSAGDHEYVVVREVVRGHEVVQEAHETGLSGWEKLHLGCGCGTAAGRTREPLHPTFDSPVPVGQTPAGRRLLGLRTSHDQSSARRYGGSSKSRAFAPAGAAPVAFTR